MSLIDISKFLKELFGNDVLQIIIDYYMIEYGCLFNFAVPGYYFNAIVYKDGILKYEKIYCFHNTKDFYIKFINMPIFRKPLQVIYCDYDRQYFHGMVLKNNNTINITNHIKPINIKNHEKPINIKNYKKPINIKNKNYKKRM